MICAATIFTTRSTMETLKDHCGSKNKQNKASNTYMYLIVFAKQLIKTNIDVPTSLNAKVIYYDTSNMGKTL